MNNEADPIIHCKDCKYAKHLRGRPGQLMKFCRKFSTPVEVWRYCSWGERASNQKK